MIVPTIQHYQCSFFICYQPFILSKSFIKKILFRYLLHFHYLFYFKPIQFYNIQRLQYFPNLQQYKNILLMDKLKSLLNSKKPQSKVVIRKDQIQKKKEQYIQKQKQNKQKELLNTQKRFKELDQFYTGQNGRKKVKTQIQKFEIPLSSQQIKTQLIKLYQPDRHQGEQDQSRYRRLLKMKKIHEQYPQIDMKNFDQNFFRKLKQKEYFEQLDSKYRDKMIEPKLGDDLQYRQNKLKMILGQKQKDLQVEQNFGQVCDLLYIWLIKILREWKQKLDQKYSKQQNKKRVQNLIRYEQTEHQLNSFLKVLKNKGGDKQMIISIYHIMNCCLVREYVQANDKYLDLSIGKAPWPMGVAMLGITVKRNAQRLSHVLNDEMTRKWVQGIKRLITVSQQLYPNQQGLKMVYLSVNSMI